MSLRLPETAAHSVRDRDAHRPHPEPVAAAELTTPLASYGGNDDPYWPDVMKALEIHGDLALHWALLEIDDLVEEGDVDGVDRMIEIARRLHRQKQ
jgi:hypothetical protein